MTFLTGWGLALPVVFAQKLKMLHIICHLMSKTKAQSVLLHRILKMLRICVP